MTLPLPGAYYKHYASGEVVRVLFTYDNVDRVPHRLSVAFVPVGRRVSRPSGMIVGNFQQLMAAGTARYNVCDAEGRSLDQQGITKATYLIAVQSRQTPDGFRDRPDEGDWSPLAKLGQKELAEAQNHCLRDLHVLYPTEALMWFPEDDDPQVLVARSSQHFYRITTQQD